MPKWTTMSLHLGVRRITNTSIFKKTIKIDIHLQSYLLPLAKQVNVNRLNETKKWSTTRCSWIKRHLYDVHFEVTHPDNY